MTTTSLTQHERRLEWALAGAAMLGGVVVAAVALSYGVTHSTGVGAGAMPAVAGLLLLVSGLVWSGQLVISGRQPLLTAGRAGLTDQDNPADSEHLAEMISEDVGDESDSHAFPDGVGWKRVGLLAGSIAAAALLLEYLGYTLTMIGLLSVILIVLAKRRAWLALLVGLAVSLASRLVFEVWLGTSLPHSVLPPFSWLGI